MEEVLVTAVEKASDPAGSTAPVKAAEVTQATSSSTEEAVVTASDPVPVSDPASGTVLAPPPPSPVPVIVRKVNEYGCR